MPVRRSAAVALSFLALVSGCKNVSQESPPSEIVIAAFNAPVKPGPVTPTNPALVPTPNDLAMQAWPTLPAGAQQSLLRAFVAAGGFPADQAVGITIPIKRLVLDPSNAYSVVAPPLVDPSTLTTTGASPTYVVVRLDGSAPALVPDVEVDVANCTAGQIALIKSADPVSGSRAWHPGRYAFAIRAGAVKTQTGVGVSADQGIALVIPNLDLTIPENQPPGGLPPALIPQLEAVRATLWNPADWNAAAGQWVPTVGVAGVAAAFPAIGKYIAPSQVAVIGTFEIAGNPVAGTPPAPAVPVDAASGIAPLPIDLLRTANHGTTIAFNPAFGPAAQGLTTLDGFSTTAMMLAQVTFPLDASTVTGFNVHVFKIQGATVTPLKELKQELALFGSGGDPTHAAYVAEPDPITTTAGNFVVPGVPCAVARCSVAIGLQPAIGAPTPLGAINMPPLDEGSDYAVVITTGVKDMLGRPFQKSTVAKILVDPGFDPVATSSVDGISLLAGIDNATATALEKMREQLRPVLAAAGLTANDVALAYTFRTQSVKTTSLSLVGLPYTLTGAPFFAGIANEDPAVLTTFAPSDTAAQYGFDADVLPTAVVPEIAEVRMRTVSLLLASQNQGAFDPAHLSSELITAIVAIPDKSLQTGTCPTLPPPFPAYSAVGVTACAPLVVFEHGITDSKAEVLPLAAALASRGFVVVAIDQAMRGDRSYCSGSGAGAQAAANQMCCPTALCGAAGGTCVFKPNLSSPVDVDSSGNPIQLGLCQTATGGPARMLAHRLDGATPSVKGTAFASANQLLSLNFFRLRDVFRQDVADESAAVMAFAPIGPPVPGASDVLASYLRDKYGLAVDFTKVYLAAHSGGAISGAQTMAVNPRISRAVTYAGGATFVDIANDPQSHFHSVLLSLLPPGSGPGTPSFLKLLQVAKWVLDPAEPANYAPFVVPGSLPSPFAGSALAAFWPTQPARQVLTQLSLCDGTVPNTENLYYSAMLGLQAPATPATATTGRVQWFSQTGAATCPADAVSHGNIVDFATPTLTEQAQSFMAGFLASPSDVVTPVLP